MPVSRRHNVNIPDPRGSLSMTVPSSAIAAANKEVLEMKVDKAKKRRSKRGHYYSYTAKQRAEIGKYASQNGVQAAKIKYSRELGIVINESTVRKFKKLYTDELSKKRRARNSTPVTELTLKKRGRPLLLGDRLDEMVKQYVADTRKVSGTIGTDTVRAGARGILLSLDRSRLAEFSGPVTLTKAWAVSLLKRMGYTQRKGTTKLSLPPDNFLQLKFLFLNDIIDIVKMEEIPIELIFNWDQTGLNLVPAATWSMAPKGSKRVEIKGFEDKRQVTAVFCASLVGDFLPIQLVYGGKTNRHPSYSFPCEWNVTHSENHWSNESTMLTYLETIIIPYVESVREHLGLDDNQSALAIYDHFKGQLTKKVSKVLVDHNIQTVLVPPSCTDCLQPLDISVNKSAKCFLKSEFRKWYLDEVTQQLSIVNGDIDSIDPIDLSTARMKCVSAQWIVRLSEYLQSCPDIIVNGFKAISKSIDAGRPVLDDKDFESATSHNGSDESTDSASAYFSSGDDQ